jgi:hypothetical protein
MVKTRNRLRVHGGDTNLTSADHRYLKVNIFDSVAIRLPIPIPLYQTYNIIRQRCPNSTAVTARYPQEWANLATSSEIASSKEVPQVPRLFCL